MDKMRQNGSAPKGASCNTDQESGAVDTESLLYRHAYTLPTLRYVNIVLALLFVDGIVSIVLWLTGGNSEYFVDNLTHFHLKQSVYDLVLFAAVKVIVCAPALTRLETVSLQQIEDPYNRPLRRLSLALHLIPICLAFASLGLIELILFLWSFVAMRRLKVTRILHLYNDEGQEVDKKGEPVKKAVNLKRLVSLAKPESGILVLAALCLLPASGSQMAVPLFFGMAVDAAQHSMEELNRTVITLFIFYAAGSIFAMGRSWLFTLAGQRVVARLRKTLFSSIIKQEVAFFDTNRTGELCNRLSSDTQVLQNAVTVNFSMLVRYLLQMIGSLVFMFSLKPALTGVLLAVVPVVVLGAMQYGKFMMRIRKDFQDRLADAGTTAEESLSSIRTVRTFSGENKATSAYGSDVDKSYNVGKKMAAAGGIFEGGIGLMVGGSICLVLWYGGKLVYENTQDSKTGITSGVLTSFLLYTLQIAMSLALMSSLYGDFMQALGASVRIFDLMDRRPTVPIEGGTKLLELDGQVQFQSINFTYPSRPETAVIKGVTFSVEPGEMVALVGPSGGGKSTLVNLIERFYDPDSGTLTLGGHNLRDLDPMWFRQKISMVSQEPTLFACSIKDNISYGRDATEEEVIAVAKQANADEFIRAFEKGYDTLVGERGVRLSGGQKQRVAIARALLMDPTLLLLDEATSALDAESEHLVQEAIDRAMKGRTVVVIAHRLSTVRNASKVVVIDKGAIVEMGTHDELIAKGGKYKKLVLRQLTAGGMKLEDTPADKPVNTDSVDTV